MKKKISKKEYESTELPGLLGIFNFSKNIPLSVYNETTVVKIPEQLYSSANLSSQRFLQEEYLLNRKKSTLDMSLEYGVSAYSSFSVRGALSNRALKEKESIKTKNVIKLPPYKIIKKSLNSLIRMRRSMRDFTDKNMSINELSTVLFYCHGVTGDLEVVTEDKSFLPTNVLDKNYLNQLHTTPSGGALFPLDVYLFIQNVEGIKDGIYMYIPINHSLINHIELSDFSDEDIKNINSWGYNIDSSKINVTIFTVYSLYRNSRKYGDTAMDFAFIEAGQMSQNVHLSCTGMGIKSCDIGGFEKKPCEDFLGLDGVVENIINVIILGR